MAEFRGVNARLKRDISALGSSPSKNGSFDLLLATSLPVRTGFLEIVLKVLTEA